MDTVRVLSAIAFLALVALAVYGTDFITGFIKGLFGMEKATIENGQIVADTQNAQPHFCCSDSPFSIVAFFTVLFSG